MARKPAGAGLNGINARRAVSTSLGSPAFPLASAVCARALSAPKSWCARPRHTWKNGDRYLLRVADFRFLHQLWASLLFSLSGLV
jgi:hypothetical protein